MLKRTEQAMENHKKGYNCAQCVACAFCDVTGVDEETSYRMGEGFGGGMGCTKATCGAILGGGLVFGLKNSTGPSGGSKADTYKLSRALITRFEEKNGATICGELKGVGTGNVLRDCDGCIKDAVEIVEELLGV